MPRFLSARAQYADAWRPRDVHPLRTLAAITRRGQEVVPGEESVRLDPC